MRPIAETVAVATEMRRLDPGLDILSHLQGMADRVSDLVPDCVGMSVAWLTHDVTFTLVASEEEIGFLDRVQRLVAGASAEAAAREPDAPAPGGDLFDEDRWRQSARATAHRGVASTLTIPLVHWGKVSGTVHLYGGSGRAFEGQHRELAAVVGGLLSGVVRNADLSFSTRLSAEHPLARILTSHDVDLATGIVRTALGVDAPTARRRLEASADRAGITLEQLARALVATYDM